MLVGKGVQPVITHPRNVGSADRTIREGEAGRGTKHLSGTVEFGPLLELSHQPGTTVSTAAALRYHNDNVSFSRTFELQIAVELTKFEELLVIHVNRRSGVNDERLFE